MLFFYWIIPVRVKGNTTEIISYMNLSYNELKSIIGPLGKLMKAHIKSFNGEQMSSIDINNRLSLGCYNMVLFIGHFNIIYRDGSFQRIA